jgi:hypothetical protein
MLETVLERHYLDRVQSIQQLANLPASDRATMSRQDYEDLLALCVELSASARNLIEQEYNRIFKNAHLTVGWLRERRRVIEELSDRYAQLAQAVKASAQQARQTTGATNGTDFELLLDNAIKDVAQAKQNILNRWLVGSPEETAEARIAIAQGDTEDADEAFAEIAGVDVKTWREGIAEYKQRQHQSGE